MAAVFGDVLYWLATLIAGITIGVALYPRKQTSG